MRQHFWKQYDADGTGALSNIELTSVLDSLGSTLSTKMVNSFTCNGKKLVEDDLTVHEAIRCLEMRVGWPPNEKRVVPVVERGSLLHWNRPGTLVVRVRS